MITKPTAKPDDATKTEEKPKRLFEHVAPAQNPAVALCYSSFIAAHEEIKDMRTLFSYRKHEIARMAYLKAMPPLAGAENIRDFIACVAHAMMLHILQPEECTRLLYAAQVAQSGSRRDQKSRKKSK